LGLKVVTARELGKFIRENLSPFAPSCSEGYSEIFLDEEVGLFFVFLLQKTYKRSRYALFQPLPQRKAYSFAGKTRVIFKKMK
jgi:hypothetical protein